MRSQHWTDRPHATNPRLHTQVVKNWSNFRRPGLDWEPSDPRAVVATNPPPDWEGSYEFGFASLSGPMQIFARDANDINNRTTIGMRRSDTPRDWINFRAIGGAAVDAVVSPDGRRIVFANLWPGCDLVYRIGPHKMKEIVRIKNKAIAPSYFEWTVKAAPGRTIEVRRNVLRMINDRGRERIKTLPPWGSDSATTAPTDDGKQFIRCTFTLQGTRNGLPVVRLTPNPDDMANAIGVVRLDPTAIISGTADIEDALLIAIGPDANYGGHTTAGVGAPPAFLDRHTIFRIATSAIPLGTYTAFRFKVWRYPHATCTAGGNMDAYIVKDANDWVEGTLAGGVQAGSCSWNSAKHAAQAWAGGGNGCGVSGTDYDADGSPPTLAFGAFPSGSITQYTLPLNEVWLGLWKGLTRLNNGVILTERSGADGARFISFTSEQAAPYTCSFEIDYVPVASSQKFFFIGF